MPNAIKYNVSPQTLSLKKGNFWIGTGDVPKGTTANTDYWNGLTPPEGSGYTIYINKATGGPSIYVANNDSELIFLTNRIASPAVYRTVTECLVYFITKTDRMVFNKDYEPIVTNGLVLNLDAGFVSSYPRTDTTWYDIGNGSVNSFNATLFNSPVFNTNNNGYLVFNGTNQNIGWSADSSLTAYLEYWWNLTSRSFEMWVFFTNLNFGILFGVASVSDFEESSGYAIFNNQIGVQAAGGTILTLGGDLSINTWYHIVFVRTNSNSHTLFINGDRISTISNIISTIQLGYDWKINMMSNEYGNHKEGSVPIFRLYDRELSQEEVLKNYNANVNRFL
jgi:hypothetical protein